MIIRETPVFFEGGSATLAGIVTEPRDSNDLVVMIPWGAGAYPSSARNRFRARLARTLAERGFHAFRFDYEGVGESDGVFRTRTLDDPFDADIVAASTWLTHRGFERQLVVGNCFGAWSTLVAVDRLPALSGIAMLNAPVKHDHHQQLTMRRSLRRWARKARRMKLGRWLDSDVRSRARTIAATKIGDVAGVQSRHASHYGKAMRVVAERRLPLLVVYGNDGFRGDFEAALESGLDRVFDGQGHLSRYELLDQPMTGYPSLAIQHKAMEVVTSWADDVARELARSTEGVGRPRVGEVGER